MKGNDLLSLGENELHKLLLKCHGMKAKAVIRDYSYDTDTDTHVDVDVDVEGIISVDGDGVFLCQNNLDGTSTDDKFGFKFSWQISDKGWCQKEIFDLQHLELLDVDGGAIEKQSKKDIYIYKGNPYTIDKESSVKINGEWVDTVQYRCEYDNPQGQYWSRLKDEFYSKFVKQENLVDLPSTEAYEKLKKCHGLKAMAYKNIGGKHGIYITGKIFIKDDCEVYLCQNDIRGLNCGNKLGYKYSYYLMAVNNPIALPIRGLQLLENPKPKEEVKKELEAKPELTEGEVYAAIIEGDDWLFRPNGKSTERDVFCYSYYDTSDGYWSLGGFFWKTEVVEARKATDDEKAQLAEKEAENGMYYCSQNKLMLKQGEYYISERGEHKWVLRFNKALQDDVYAESYHYRTGHFDPDEDCPFSNCIDRNKLRKAIKEEIDTFKQKEAEYETKKAQKELLSHGEPSGDIKIDPKLMEVSNACTETDTFSKVKGVEKLPKGERILKLSEKLAELSHHVIRGDELMKELSDEFNFTLKMKD